MSEESSFDYFTILCLGAGLLIGLIGGITYNGFLTPLLQPYLGVFGVERQRGSYQDFGTVLAVVTLGLAGAAALYASAGIERGEAVVTRTAVLTLSGLLTFTLIPTGIVAFSYAAVEGRPVGPSLSMFLFGIVGLIMIIPAVICWVAMFPLALGLAAGGLFCLPRLLFYHTVRHPLRQAWDKGQSGAQISAADISNALGHPAKNTTQARKLQAELERLEYEISQQHAQLAKDRDELRSAILGDAERFEAEKRISRMVSEFEALKAEVSVYEQYLKQGGKR